MTLDEFIRNARASKVAESSVFVLHRTYDYDILPKEFLPAVPYFVGYPEGKYLFISGEVPEEFRGGFLAHEIICTRLKDRGDPDHCRHASVSELLYVPDEADFREYYRIRLEMFEALLEYYRESDDNELLQSLAASRDQFRLLLEKSSAEQD